MEKLNLDKKTLQKFGLTMAIAFFIIGSLFFLRQKYIGARYFFVAAGIFLTLGLILPHCLKQMYVVWMRLAFILGWINTRIILFILFYLIFTPLGLLLRIFKIDLLEKQSNDATNWKKKEKIKFSPLDYERRF